MGTLHGPVRNHPKAIEHTGNDPDQKHLARRSFRLDRIQTSKHGLDVDRERAAEATIPKSCEASWLGVNAHTVHCSKALAHQSW